MMAGRKTARAETVKRCLQPIVGVVDWAGVSDFLIRPRRERIPVNPTTFAAGERTVI